MHVQPTTSHFSIGGTVVSMLRGTMKMRSTVLQWWGNIEVLEWWKAQHLRTDIALKYTSGALRTYAPVTAPGKVMELVGASEWVATSTKRRVAQQTMAAHCITVTNQKKNRL